MNLNIKFRYVTYLIFSAIIDDEEKLIHLKQEESEISKRYEELEQVHYLPNIRLLKLR